ncbi:MAG TPA: hypothetical protein VHY31_23215 [Streptosporangiaceae bacterium]|jgi:hypothetical protein|nr:hypothetical protein [Streptosporangiaceae bacterium]
MAARQEAVAPLRPPLAYRMTRRQRVAADSAVAAATVLIVAFKAGLLHGWHSHMPTAVTAGAALALGAAVLAAVASGTGPRPSAAARPSGRNGSGSPASRTTSWRTA